MATDHPTARPRRGAVVSARMTRTTVTKTIAAPIDWVFETIADIENLKRAIPHIIDIEFLSQTRTGIGTRFRETRLMKGKEATTELEVT